MFSLLAFVWGPGSIIIVLHGFRSQISFRVYSPNVGLYVVLLVFRISFSVRQYSCNYRHLKVSLQFPHRVHITSLSPISCTASFVFSGRKDSSEESSMCGRMPCGSKAMALCWRGSFFNVPGLDEALQGAKRPRRVSRGVEGMEARRRWWRLWVDVILSR